MFDFVRSHNRLLQVLLGILIVPSFAIFGVQSYTRMNGDEVAAVAEVDGRDISRVEWDNQQRQNTDRARMQDPQADLKKLDGPEARRATLESIVRDRVLLAASVHENLAVTPDRVDAFIRTDPQFAQLRSLDKGQLTALLAQQGLTKDGLYANVTDALNRQQPLQGLVASATVPAVTSKAALGAWFGHRDIQWQRFDAKDYLAAINPTDAQVQAYYGDKSHAARFAVPEQARIDYVVLDLDTLKAQVPVTDAALHTFYDAHKPAYTAAEERRASHILIKVEKGAVPADVARAQAQAQALLAEVRKNPASFADVARKNSQDAGSAAQGGDLDFIRRDAIPGAFGDAVFAMKPGDISDVVRSDAGFHVIQLTGVRGGVPKPFDEVRAQVEDQFRAQEAQKMFAADADKFTNTVYEQPDSLQPAITAFKLTPQSALVQRAPQAGQSGALASQRLLDAVFANESLHGKHNTEAVETGASQLASAHVTEYLPRHQRTLAEVHDQIVASLRAELASAAAKKDADARAADATKNPALALPLSANVGRDSPAADIPRSVVDASLRADLAKGAVVTTAALPDGGYATIRVLRNVPLAPGNTQAQQAKGLVEQAYEDVESKAVYDALKARYKTRYHEDRIAKGADAAASSSN